MPPVIDLDKCERCGTCDAHCPLDVILFDQKKGVPIVKYPDECWHCGSCRLDCPVEAITIKFGPEMLYI
ncbi:MAG TPA: ferredoxin family protein [Syntrophorhabdales bacterium]|nr:ferredoxin family protein [Syntrophorhabdales bacterium]